MNIFKIALWKKIIIGMILGLVIGSLEGKYAAYLQPLGDVFISAIEMLVIPLVFCSLVTAMTAVSDIKKLSRIGGKSIFFYIITSVLAISIGLVLGSILHPGVNSNVIGVVEANIQVTEIPSILDILINIVPTNPIESLSSGNILQVLFFAILLGLSINLCGKKTQALVPIFDAGASAMYKLASMVMEIAPYGVFALMAGLAARHGIAYFLPLLNLIMVIYLGFFLLLLVVYIPIIYFIMGLSPAAFLKKIREALILAFSTSSSSATLPVSMSCAENKLGISKMVTSIVLPLGATINMNGTALYQGVATLFIAQLYGIDITLNQMLVVVLTSLLGAIGTAGVPGSGVIMLSVVLNAIGLPLEGIGLILAVDRIIDMGRTAFNVAGDLIAATVIAKSEKEINFDIMNEAHVAPLKATARQARQARQIMDN